MKKKQYALLFLPIVLAAFIHPLAGQQMPWFSVYSNQPKYLNPAAQGGASGGSVGLAYRMQYSELPTDSRPVTYMLHADVSPLLSDRIGLGILVMQDEVHITKRTNVTGFFGYHLFPKESNFRLSLGAMAGVLNQRMELGTATVSDPFDLELMKGTESKTQFDGGMGLQAQFLQDGGSGLHIDVVLPQLFTSDLSFTPEGATRNVRYDLLPHLLSTVRYRWQGAGFALEPNVVYRESFGKKLKKANFDFHLRGYLLKNNLLMLGTGYRLDEGGLLFSLGVKPMANLNIQLAYENHSALGSTFEVGAQYTFGEGGPCKPGVAEKELDTHKATAILARQAATSMAITARDKIAFAKAALNDAKNAQNYQTQQSKLENADKYIAQAVELQTKIRAEVVKSATAEASANDLLKQAATSRRRLCNADEMEPLREAAALARQQESDVSASILEIQNTRSTITPMLNVNDPAALQSYFAGALKNLTDKPDEIRVVKVTATTIEFLYPDADEAYTLPKVKSFADFLATRSTDLKRQGVSIESVRLVADLLYSKVDARVDLKYKAEHGDPLKATYKLNSKDKTSNLKKDASLTLETLAMLKIFDLKRYLAPKIGLPEEKIFLEITAPNASNEYSQMTKVILNYKK